MECPVFSLAYTSVRPNMIPQVVRTWNERAADPTRLEWVICVDQGDEESYSAAKVAQAHSKVPVRVETNFGPKTCVAGWNTAAAATRGQVIIAVADDFSPPQNWDQCLLNLQPSDWITKDCVVHVEDGYVHDLIVLPIVTQVRYRQFGYLYFPGYLSLFCDTEFTAVAYRDGVVLEAKHLLFEHLHPDCGKRSRDHVDSQHASSERWNAGEMLFNFRKAQGFPSLVNPDKPERPLDRVPSDFAAYFQVTQDDFCLLDVCQRIFDEGVRSFFFSVPDTYWSGEPVPEEKMTTLLPVYAALEALGARVEIKKIHVEHFQVGQGQSRIAVETQVRNASLAWIRTQGFEHILVVDGDELWKPGLLQEIIPLVQAGHTAISVHMTPVIGNPGYPVESASDVAVVYIGPKTYFRVCRTPTAQQTVLGQIGIIHFTGTRRTHEETVVKHRRSGHYDDPDYDFEGWLENVLPKVAPGLKNAHMFKPYQIWKEVRNWRPEELGLIPQGLHPFLGLPQ